MAGLGGTARGRRRLIITLCLLGLTAAGLVARLVYLMVILPAREPGEPLVLPQVERGAILDRRGRILAITTRHQDVSAWAPGITDPQGTAALLGPILGMDPAALQDGWRRRPGYSVIKRRLAEGESAAIAALRGQGKLAGIRLEDGYGRMYPEGRLASTLIGTVGVDNTGLEGIEYTFNDELAPQTVGTDRDTVYGSQVVLTIDAAVQYRVERVARAAFGATRADSLMVLVLDADTAEVLAWVSLPDFDPNEVQTGSSTAGQLGARRPAGDDGLRAGIGVQGLLPRLAPRAGHHRRLVHVHLPGILRAGAGRRFENAHRVHPRARDRGPPTHPLVLVQCRRRLRLRHRDEGRFRRGSRPVRLRTRDRRPAAGRERGICSRPSRNGPPGPKPTIAFGQELSVSAIQVAAAAVAIADGGTLLEPLVVGRIVSPDGKVVKAFGRKPLWEAVSARTARQVLDMMESATGEGGTARRAAIEGLRISAKTGTAQVTDPATGRYSKTDFIASMLGIFPTDDPEVVVYVVIQNPRGESYFGSTIAAPVFRDVALELVDALGIGRDGRGGTAAAGTVDGGRARGRGDRRRDARPRGYAQAPAPAAARARRPAGSCSAARAPSSARIRLRGLPSRAGMRIVLELE